MRMRIQTLLLLFIFIFSHDSFAAETRGYDDLLSALRVEQTSPQDRVAASWKMGKLMEQDAEEHKLWAGYREETNKRLAVDLNLRTNDIRDLRQFARVFPEMPSPELGWGHYLILIYVHPAEIRTAFMKQALQEHWPKETLRLEVRKYREAQKKTFKTERDILKTPGELNTYRVVKALSGVHEGKLVVDLGFDTQKILDESTPLTEGDFVDENLQRVSPKEENLFTYAANVTKILDGDTFEASVDLGFGLSVKQTFRLNGVDAPELSYGEGITAKTFVYDEIMRAGGKIILRAGEPDKYNRILAEVWVNGESLNQKMVENQHAVAA